MSAHVFMFRLTPEGAKNLAKLGELRQQSLKKFEEMGVKLVGSYFLLGPSDVVVIVEGLDDKQAMAHAARLASSGWVTTETYAAIPTEEALDVLSNI